jgi:integrase
LTVLEGLPKSGAQFPGLSVNMTTNTFAKLRDGTGLDHLVIHGTRKWFITQCERTGVPEHFTASLVGHKAARSVNGITYAIYSGGISDDQKRGIIEQIRLPT